MAPFLFIPYTLMIYINQRTYIRQLLRYSFLILGTLCQLVHIRIVLVGDAIDKAKVKHASYVPYGHLHYRLLRK